MRHRKAGLKLNRTPSHRNAMFRNMVTSLLKHDRIRTTGAKAKELRRWADHIITLAKRGDLHARRQALAIVREKDVVHKLFENAAERFGGVSGGYTRVVKLGRRPGDAAPVALVELVVSQDTKKKKAKKKKAKADTAPKKDAAVKKDAVKATESDEQKTEAPANAEAAEEEKPAAKPAPKKKAKAKEKEAGKKKPAKAKEAEKPKKETPAVPEEPAADDTEAAADSKKTDKDEQ
jgi:large subunit ribosomal protein L17